MSATFQERGGAPVLGLPQPLFQLGDGVDDRWELSPDGKSFLINELADSASSIEPYFVVTGWKDAMER